MGCRAQTLNHKPKPSTLNPKPYQVDDLIDEKLGGPSSPIKAKAMPRSKSISAKKGRRSSAVVDEKQSTHNQLALMDIDNLQLAVGQVHSCPHRVWFVCVCVCVCVCV